MTTEWVDFKKVKGAVDMQMVLDHYGINGLTKSGDELRGPCPIHKGLPRSKNFTVNLRKNAFKCFSSDCKAHGNVLDFVAAIERCDVRDAALKLAEWFKVGESESPSENHSDQVGDKTEVSRGIYADREGALFEVITTALSSEDFEPLVVYRELSGDYGFWVARPENFGLADCRLTLVKAL
jgi:hypothetical protein